MADHPSNTEPRGFKTEHDPDNPFRVKKLNRKFLEPFEGPRQEPLNTGIPTLKCDTMTKVSPAVAVKPIHLSQTRPSGNTTGMSNGGNTSKDFVSLNFGSTQESRTEISYTGTSNSAEMSTHDLEETLPDAATEDRCTQGPDNSATESELHKLHDSEPRVAANANTDYNITDDSSNHIVRTKEFPDGQMEEAERYISAPESFASKPPSDSPKSSDTQYSKLQAAKVQTPENGSRCLQFSDSEGPTINLVHVDKKPSALAQFRQMQEHKNTTVDKTSASESSKVRKSGDSFAGNPGGNTRFVSIFCVSTSISFLI